MNILIANDDGLQAEGLRRLAERMAKTDTVYISAPATQMSGASHSLSMGKSIRMEEVAYEGAAMALQVTGTPSDCVSLGLQYFKNKGITIDFVLSGINHGSNLGTDTIYSGTVGAAMEGAIKGKPSVAVSINSGDPQNYEPALDLTAQVVAQMKANPAGPNLVNINLPDLPADKLSGVCTTKLGKREYQEGFRPEDITGTVTEYSYKNSPVVYDSHDIAYDVIADQDGYASVTPLQFDFTDNHHVDTMKGWELTI